MNDETTREFDSDEDREFYEKMRAMSAVDMLAHMKQVRDELSADGGKLAREQGLSREYVEKISADIEKFEQAMRDEQLANQKLVDVTSKISAAADRMVEQVDPEYPNVVE